jgi:Asp-tRNA(Asn)/Glu-tRNA(Gln) amidotransferase A subunit family amidase
MDDPGFHALTLVAAADEIAAGTLSARALAGAQLARIAATDGAIEAWAHLDPAHVAAKARRRDAAPMAHRGPLHGLGIGVKDIIGTADQPTELGTPIYAGRRPAHDAVCVERLRRAGAYVFGKTITTEFAFMNPACTRNPWNHRHTPGGSSSGSAAAVAAGHVTGALGTQTNGSVIRPAAYCGVVGFKPTKAAISYAGCNVFSRTLDQLGTFTRTVADAARLASPLADAGRIAGTIMPLAAPPRLAYLPAYPWIGNDCDADDTLEAAVTRLRAHAEVVPVKIPEDWQTANAILRTIMLFEAAVEMAALQDRERARLSENLNAALDEGRAILRADYDAAMIRRSQAIVSFTGWCEGFDAILSPAAPAAAPAGLDSTGDPSCCTLWSLLGFPAITIPVGLVAGMPIGMQLSAAAGADDRLLAVASWCEARLPFRGLV